MIEINRRAYRAHELNEKYEIKKTEKKTFLEEERISETLTVGHGPWDGSRTVLSLGPSEVSADNRLSVKI